MLPGKIRTDSDEFGAWRISGLQPGTYTLEVAKPGFSVTVYDRIPVPINSVVTLDVRLAISAAKETVTVLARPAMLEPSNSSTGSVILPQQLEGLPINGRNYLDLMQLVPGVVVNRREDASTDSAVPVLGDRGGNAMFLVDGLPNKNLVDGGAAAPFNQDSILEFQVLTSGYKAEFGHGSGGVVNVLSKSGTNQWHGMLSAFHRNSVLDSSDVPGANAPFLLRWDPDGNIGGPLVRNRVYVFGSLERIRESRQLNFIFPPNTPDFLKAREQGFDQHNQTFEIRGFLKFDEQAGHHRLTEEANLANGHVTNFLPLSQAISVPSTRTDSDWRYLMWGLHDSATLGDQNNPFLFSAYLQYRGEPLTERPANPQAGPATTIFNIFSGMETGRLTGDLGQVKFGAGFTPLTLRQQYLSSGANLDKVAGRHEIKFGWDFQRTRADGVEASNLLSQLFATSSDFSQFGPVNAGVYVLTTVAGQTAAENAIRLRNNYDGLFIQDDWKITRHLTVSQGLRWDYDSRFPNFANFSPRLGIAWSPGGKTVLSASWGIFEDNFRLGLARDIPSFGGASLYRNQTISFPRLFYGDPSMVPLLGGLCVSPVLTDAQIAATASSCASAGLSLLGVDHLNGTVAAGHASIPANAVVNTGNLQNLTGLTAQQFADAASAAVGRQPGFFFWGGLGNLSTNFVAPPNAAVPVTVDPSFSTPYTRNLHLGAQRELGANSVIQLDYYHRDIRNILGVRTANLAFEARLPGQTGKLQPDTGSRPILSYGPWYQGRYDGITVGFRRRMTRRFTVEAFYTWANAVDNAFNPNLISEVQTGLGAGALAVTGPTDSFVGIPPVVKDPVTGQTNANGLFIASNGNPVPQAGKFYYGPNLDRGPSDLALNHTALVDGIVHLCWHLDLSGIARAQSGLHFSGSPAKPVDVDGDGVLNGVDFLAGRNHFEAPRYINLDLRLSKRFAIAERLHVQALVEFFNILNRANPAAVEQLEQVPTPLGKPLQYLPGREGQVGLRIEF